MASTKIKVISVVVFSIFMILSLHSQQKAYFLHHSVGNGVFRGGNVETKINEYNSINNTDFQIYDKYYPNDPYTWDNYPYDYWNLWVNEGECDSENENIECLESMLENYDIIIFKHCYPGADISPDPDVPNVSSARKSLANYKLQYRALRDKMASFPDKKFVVWTLAPLHRLSTNEEKAARARAFVNWVKDEWLEEDGIDHPNIFIFDFFNLVGESKQEPEFGKINCLKYEYEKDHNGRNSHPNAQANIDAGQAFADFMITVFKTELNTTQTNLEPKIQIELFYDINSKNLHFRSNNREDGNIYILDMLGKNYNSYKCSQNNTFSLSHLKQGLYFAVYKNKKNEVLVKKIII